MLHGRKNMYYAYSVCTQTREDVLDVVVERGKGRIRYPNYFKCVNLRCIPNINLRVCPLNSQMCFTAAPVF